MKQILEEISKRAMDAAQAQLRLAAAVDAYVVLLGANGLGVPHATPETFEKVIEQPQCSGKTEHRDAKPENILGSDDWGETEKPIRPATLSHLEGLRLLKGGATAKTVTVTQPTETRITGLGGKPVNVPDVVEHNGRKFVTRPLEDGGKFGQGDLVYDHVHGRVTTAYRSARGSEGKAYFLDVPGGGERVKVDTPMIFRLVEFMERKDADDELEPEEQDEPENVQADEDEATESDTIFLGPDEGEEVTEDEGDPEESDEESAPDADAYDLDAKVSALAKSERKVYDALVELSPDGETKVGYREVAKKTGLGNVPVIQCLAALNDAGLVDMDDTGHVTGVKGVEKANKHAKMASKAAASLARAQGK